MDAKEKKKAEPAERTKPTPKETARRKGCHFFNHRDSKGEPACERDVIQIKPAHETGKKVKIPP